MKKAAKILRQLADDILANPSEAGLEKNEAFLASEEIHDIAQLINTGQLKAAVREIAKLDKDIKELVPSAVFQFLQKESKTMKLLYTNHGILTPNRVKQLLECGMDVQVAGPAGEISGVVEGGPSTRRASRDAAIDADMADFGDIDREEREAEELADLMAADDYHRNEFLRDDNMAGDLDDDDYDFSQEWSDENEFNDDWLNSREDSSGIMSMPGAPEEDEGSSGIMSMPGSPEDLKRTVVESPEDETDEENSRKQQAELMGQKRREAERKHHREMGLARIKSEELHAKIDKLSLAGIEKLLELIDSRKITETRDSNENNIFGDETNEEMFLGGTDSLDPSVEDAIAASREHDTRGRDFIGPEEDDDFKGHTFSDEEWFLQEEKRLTNKIKAVIRECIRQEELQHSQAGFADMQPAVVAEGGSSWPPEEGDESWTSAQVDAETLKRKKEEVEEWIPVYRRFREASKAIAAQWPDMFKDMTRKEGIPGNKAMAKIRSMENSLDNLSQDLQLFKNVAGVKKKAAMAMSKNPKLAEFIPVEIGGKF